MIILNMTDFYILQQNITINLKQGKSVCGAGFVVQSTYQWTKINYTIKKKAEW
jgi:hypothetical protein